MTSARLWVQWLIMKSRPQFSSGSTTSNPIGRPSMALSSQLGPTKNELAWSSISLTSSPSPHSSHAKPLTVGPLHLHWGWPRSSTNMRIRVLSFSVLGLSCGLWVIQGKSALTCQKGGVRQFFYRLKVFIGPIGNFHLKASKTYCMNPPTCTESMSKILRQNNGVQACSPTRIAKTMETAASRCLVALVTLPPRQSVHLLSGMGGLGCKQNKF